MRERVSRRQAIKDLSIAGAGLAISGGIIRGQTTDIVVAGVPVEIAVSSVSPATVRITVRPIVDGAPAPVAVTGALERELFGKNLAAARAAAPLGRVRAGNLTVRFTPTPPTLVVETAQGAVVQRLVLNADTPGMSFLLPKGPLLGLGEGGVQFDKKGSTDQMRNGQVTSQADGYRLAIHGTRAPIQWLVGTRRLGDVHPPALRRVRLHRDRRQVHTARRDGAPARRLRRVVARPGRHHARVRAHHRAAGNAGALDVRLPAVVAHARGTGRDPWDREDIP